MNEALTPATLAERWATLTADEPKLRIRDAAARLDASEAQLVATRVGDGVVRLNCEPGPMLEAVPSFGHVMALTRNEAVVHEREGTYEDVQIGGHASLVLGPDIDLRCFLRHWATAFAVTSESPRGTLHSVQFFDAAGDAVHKIYLREESDKAAYDAFVERFRAEDQSTELEVQPRASTPAPKPDADIDVDGFRAAWLEMNDTHDFFGILRKFGVARTQALRLAPEGHADRLDLKAFERTFEQAAEEQTPIMVFVGNAGCIQIHSGPVRRLKQFGDWFNVLDPAFNLHANLSHISEVWRVRKPTEDGMVTSVEAFDADGQTLAMLFGARKPGVPELPAWRKLADALV